MNEELWNDPRLTEFALGEMPPDEAKAFEASIQDQPEKLAFVAEMRRVADACQAHYSSEANSSKDNSSEAATLAVSRRAQPSSTLANDASGGRRWLAFGLLAASVLLVLGFTVGPKLSSRSTSDVAMDAVLSSDEKARTSGLAMEVERSIAFDDTTEIAEIELAQSRFETPASGDHPFAPETSVDGVVTGGADQVVAWENESTVSSDVDSDSKALPILSKRLGARAMVEAREQDSSGTPSGAVMESVLGEQVSTSEWRSLGRAGREGVRGQDSRGLAPVQAGLSPLADKESEEIPTELMFAMGDVAANASQPTSGPVRSESPRRVAGLQSPPASRAPYFGRPASVDELGLPNQDFDLELRQGVSLGGMQGGLSADGLDPTKLIPEGTGPGLPGDRYDPIEENEFKKVSEHPLSTFSIDVDTASYTKVRGYLNNGQLPRPDMVRIEEFINYFDYDLQAPADDAEHPFATDVAISSCPWNDQHHLARISLAGKTMTPDKRPPANLVFLIDTSGSMNQANKLPLVVEGLKLLTKQLNKDDRVAIVVYAGSAGLVLDSTPAKKKRKKKIVSSLQQLSAGGSTNGGAGIALAYNVARDNFIEGGVNRVILCSDGDFNVGTTSTDALVDMVEKEAKSNLFLTVLGFGYGNHNDAMMEQISGRGNGNYGFIDTRKEAEEWFVKRLTGTLVTIAKDVKLQIEFSPKKVGAYRLIGYENRVLAKEDFNDDKKDAGEIGAGHQVTALYELVPPGVQPPQAKPDVDPLRYQNAETDDPGDAPEDDADTAAGSSDEWMFVKLRYKDPEADESTKIEVPVIRDAVDFEEADANTRWAATVAGFAMQLRRSDFVGSWRMTDVHASAEALAGKRDGDRGEKRKEFVSMVRQAGALMGERTPQDDSDETASVGVAP